MRRAVFALAAISALLLSGCAAETAFPPSTSPLTEPSPTPSATPEKDIIAEARKVLGPAPVGVPLTAEQEEAARLAEVERSWVGVHESYPDAKRPTAEFEKYVTGQDRWRTILTCLNEHGIYRVGHIKNAQGEDVGFELMSPRGR